jgi:phosphoribosylformylglycinamidine synthase
VNLSPAPYFDLDEEWNLQQALTTLIQKNLIHSAHDISEGGLITALLESAFPNTLGFEASAPLSFGEGSGVRPDAFWFGEGQSRVIVSVSEKQRTDFWQELERLDIPFISLGKVTSGDVAVNGKAWGHIGDWKTLYDTAIERHLVKELDSEGALTMI